MNEQAAGAASGGLFAPPRNKKPPRGNRCMRPEGSPPFHNWMGGGKKRTNSPIGAGETQAVFSVFTEKRKIAGFSLKSCTEYTKINGKFNRGFMGLRRPRNQNRAGGRVPPAARTRAKSVGRKGRPLRPLLVTPQKGARFIVQPGARLPFSRRRGFIRAKCESAPPAPLGA